MKKTVLFSLFLFFAGTLLAAPATTESAKTDITVSQEVKEIELTRNNLIGLAFAGSNQGGIITNKGYRDAVIGLAFCKDDGTESIGACITGWSAEVRESLQNLVKKARNQGRTFTTVSEDNSDSETKVEGYLTLDSARLKTEKIGKKSGLKVEIDIKKNDEKDVGAEPTVELLKEGEEITEKAVSWDQDIISFDWKKAWESGSKKENVDFGMTLKEGSKNGFSWKYQSTSIGTGEIVRCGPRYVYSNFHDSYSNTEYDGCIEHNDEVRSGIDEVEKNTGWTLKNTNSVVDTLKSVSGEESGTGETLSINTGENSYCGRVYFQNEYIGGEDKFDIDAKMHTMGDPDRIGWHQGSKTFFAEVNGETVVEKSIEHGNSESFQPEVSTGDIVRLGIVDEPSPPLFGCNSYDSRAHVEMTVEGSFYKNQEEESTRENVFRER